MAEKFISMTSHPRVRFIRCPFIRYLNPVSCILPENIKYGKNAIKIRIMILPQCHARFAFHGAHHLSACMRANHSGTVDTLITSK